MPNMSHCRFENTANDLQDCLDALDDGASPDNLGEDESAACVHLIKLCREISDVYGDLASDDRI